MVGGQCERWASWNESEDCGTLDYPGLQSKWGLAKSTDVGQSRRTMTRKKLVSVCVAIFLTVFFACAGTCVGQEDSSPQEGSREVQVWVGGGHSVPGGTSRTGIFDLGLRYGWVLTGA